MTKSIENLMTFVECVCDKLIPNVPRLPPEYDESNGTILLVVRKGEHQETLIIDVARLIGAKAAFDYTEETLLGFLEREKLEAVKANVCRCIDNKEWSEARRVLEDAEGGSN